MGFEAACFASPSAWICADLYLIPACAFCDHRLRRRQSMPDSGLERHRHHLPRLRLGHSHA